MTKKFIPAVLLLALFTLLPFSSAAAPEWVTAPNVPQLTNEEAEAQYGLSISCQSHYDLGVLHPFISEEKQTLACTFTMTNNGDKRIDIIEDRPSDDRVLVSHTDNLTLRPGETQTYTVYVTTPREAGTYNFPVRFYGSYDPKGYNSINLGFGNQILLDGITSEVFLIEPTTFSLESRGEDDPDLSGILTLSTTELDLGTHSFESRQDGPMVVENAFTLTNNSQQTLIFGRFQAYDPEEDGYFELIPHYGANIGPGETFPVTVRFYGVFNSQYSGSASATLRGSYYIANVKDTAYYTDDITIKANALFKGGHVIKNTDLTSDHFYGVTVDESGTAYPIYGSKTCVAPGGSTTYYFRPSDPSAYHVEVTVDDVNLGCIPSYTFTNVHEDHTISWAYVPGPSPTVENPSSWAQADVDRAKAEGILPASLQGKYTAPATRAEYCALATALYEKVKGEITQRSTFTDTSDPNVEKMAAIGVVDGMGDGTFAPNSNLTREQAATMLSRLAKALDKPLAEASPTFSDSTSISPWASAAVGQVQASQIMNGMGDNKFSPWGSYTREQCVITMVRLLDKIR